MLHAEQCAQHVRVERGRIAVGRLADDGTRLTLSTCDIDGGVDASELGDGPINEIANVLIATNVRSNEDGLRAEFPELGFQRFSLDLATTGNDEASSTFGESQGGSAADAGQRSGNQNNGLVHVRPLGYAYW